MSKVTIEMEMPKGCLDCQLCVGLGNYCTLLQEIGMNNKKRPKRCPLKTPQLSESVEEALKRMYEALLGNEDGGQDHYCMYTVSSIPIEKDYNEVLQHIQALTKANEEYKAEQNLFAMANRKLLKQNNAIREVVKDKYIYKSNESTLAMIKFILEEE